MYNTSTLLTVQDCETSLNMANRDMASYAYKVTTIGYRRDNSSRTAQEVQADLLVIQAEITTLNATIAALPEGPVKEGQITKLMRKEVQLRTLSGRGTAASAVNILDQELELSRLNLLQDETQAFIDVVTTRKTAIETAV